MIWLLVHFVLCVYWVYWNWKQYYHPLFLADKTLTGKGKRRRPKVTSNDGWAALVSALKSSSETEAAPQDADMAFGQFVGFRLKAMTDERKNKCMSEILQSISASSIQPEGRVSGLGYFLLRKEFFASLLSVLMNLTHIIVGSIH